jgi:hypothetical protein
MANRRRSPGITVTLPPEAVDRLKNRGARSDRSGGPFNYARQLSRTLELYESVVIKSDPRETRGLSEEHYDLILDVIREPQELETFRIHWLGDYLLEFPAFVEGTRALGADPDHLAETINGYGFAEKLHLVESAQFRHAPPASRPHRPPTY